MIRARVPALDQDRYMTPDIEATKAMVRDGVFTRMIPAGLLPSLG